MLLVIYSCKNIIILVFIKNDVKLLKLEVVRRIYDNSWEEKERRKYSMFLNYIFLKK